jgi:hypothetical protein
METDISEVRKLTGRIELSPKTQLVCQGILGIECPRLERKLDRETRKLGSWVTLNCQIVVG